MVAAGPTSEENGTGNAGQHIVMALALGAMGAVVGALAIGWWLID